MPCAYTTATNGNTSFNFFVGNSFCKRNYEVRKIIRRIKGMRAKIFYIKALYCQK